MQRLPRHGHGLIGAEPGEGRRPRDRDGKRTSAERLGQDGDQLAVRGFEVAAPIERGEHTGGKARYIEQGL